MAFKLNEEPESIFKDDSNKLLEAYGDSLGLDLENIDAFFLANDLFTDNFVFGQYIHKDLNPTQITELASGMAIPSLTVSILNKNSTFNAVDNNKTVCDIGQKIKNKLNVNGEYIHEAAIKFLDKNKSKTTYIISNAHSRDIELQTIVNAIDSKSDIAIIPLKRKSDTFGEAQKAKTIKYSDILRWKGYEVNTYKLPSGHLEKGSLLCLTAKKQ